MSSVRASSDSQTSDFEAVPGAYPPPDADPSPISTHQTLSQAVHSRRDEFTRPHQIRVKVGSWNVAALGGTEKDIAGWFIGGKGIEESLSGLPATSEEQPQFGLAAERSSTDPKEGVAAQEGRSNKKASTIPKNDTGALPGGDEIGIYALGLQEIVDVTSATEALRPYTDPSSAKKWKQYIEVALPQGYQLVAEQQLIGMLLLIYAAPSIAPTISAVSTTSVGTGLMGYMGNKGAVTARLLLGETTRLVFINSHLSAGTEKGALERRNWDAAQVVARTKFDVVSQPGEPATNVAESIGDEDFAFWFGDLNYRLEGVPGDDVRRLLMLHTREVHDIGDLSEKKMEDEISRATAATNLHRREVGSGSFDSSASSNTAVDSSSNRSTSPTATLSEPQDTTTDPSSLQTTIDSLLTHDQLYQEQRRRRAFQDGWREGPITFPPTYKYDVGSVGMFDSGEKKRGPSWCDRILYRTRRDKLKYDQKIREEEEARKKDEDMKKRGLDKAFQSDEDLLYDYDPDTDGTNEPIEDYDEETMQEPDPEVTITKEGFEDRLKLDYYVAHQRVLSSDHKPLDAVFTLSYDAVVPELKAKIHQEVARELDRAENEGRPSVTIVVDPHHRDRDGASNDQEFSATFEGVDFGDVHFSQSKRRSATIANTGRVPATVGFIERPVADGKPGGLSPPWLNLEFDQPGSDRHGTLKELMIDPGMAVNLELELRVDDFEQVRALNDGRETLDDVLVLRVTNGRDHFLPVHGNWQQSSFSRTLDKLIRIPEGGVRKLQHQRPSGDDSATDEQGVKWSAPRELFRLTEAIEELVERSLAEWSMTSSEEEDKAPWDTCSGWPFASECWTMVDDSSREALLFEIREALDTDRPLRPVFPAEMSSIQCVESLSETLLTFLQSLEDGIITESLWVILEEGLVEREKAKKSRFSEEERAFILERLSSAPTHNVSFMFLTFMLARVANEIAPVPRSDLEDAPASPKSAHQSTSRSPSLAKRQAIDRAYAAIFADAMIRGPAAQREKEKRASEERKRHVIEVFLRAKWDEER
ncbi:MAG: hypothetical protein M1819_007098 [Sarea resinae]|nr:MAG: hypothetical protein M1819_007098 [Sarea resinae]